MLGNSQTTLIPILRAVPATIRIAASKVKQFKSGILFFAISATCSQVTWDQVAEIAKDKMPDLNCFTLEAAMRMVAGTARSMGISVVGEFPNM